MSALDKGDLRHVLRRERRERVAALTPARREAAGAALASAVLGFVPPDAGPATVAVYESLPDEPPTGELVRRLVEAGHTVLVPVTLDDWSLDWTPARVGTVADRATTSRTTRQQAAEGLTLLGPDTLARCDLVVVPALAVDADGSRLGQGGGCYDRALAHRDPAAPVVALVHDGELSPTPLPREPHDVPVDGWVTTTGEVGRASSAGG
ncbi:5-formyltetrahydrofolate cyclo-ligase [Terracoccus luteus]|jgi:5-formyltetrahydrofolate cyclo-ligase|uniref:5-formyltetrahydrofolate cyclo-ligase n=1 Tax=Terracoccus luteus TaxID=53356 RepID=A0A839PZ05_9MICO|nr:5-formyltetrahydrofolate cyclo-ligase [Terracoccus luteus]MBB2986022.1 5-formyltetrahydrofolate cyclo-ligase [Terracoccus luteus]MCP2171674.1 5-formyltetrahydrofolate cyclo-ligase [Terracoccus luteus]